MRGIRRTPSIPKEQDLSAFTKCTDQQLTNFNDTIRVGPDKFIFDIGTGFKGLDDRLNIHRGRFYQDRNQISHCVKRNTGIPS
jgi:hypothetical protein